MKTLKIVTLLFVALTIFSSWSGHSTNHYTPGVPQKLVIAIFQGESPAKFKAAAEPFMAYIQKKTGIDVSFYYATDYADVTAAIRSNKAQMAHITAYNYVLATEQPGIGISPVATLGIDGYPTVHHSIIFTNPQTGVKTIDDLMARSKSFSLAFANRASTSGHLIPRTYLTAIGLNPDSAFKSTTFAGGHAAVIMGVKRGKYDIGCSTSDQALDQLVKLDSLKAEDVVILWTSYSIPNEALTARADADKDMVKKIQDAYMSAAKEDAAAFQNFAIFFGPHPETMAYIPATDDMYSGLRSLAAGMKNHK